MSIGLNGNADGSGSIQVGGTDAIAIDTSQIVTMNGGIQRPLLSGTAVASTSGTSIDFTGIPSWVKRITVMFSGVSTSGSANYLVQLGYQNPVTTTGYVSTGNSFNQTNSTGGTNNTTGFVISGGGTANVVSGQMTITTLGSNVWVSSHTVKISTTNINLGGGNVTLSGTLDRIRITTTSTDTFDAGSINILYE